MESHTDNVPIAFSDRFISNWDLSAARAASGVLFSESVGVDMARMKVAGFADTKPQDTNETPAGRAVNRNIEIIVGGRSWPTKKEKLREENPNGESLGSEEGANDEENSEAHSAEVKPRKARKNRKRKKLSYFPPKSFPPGSRLPRVQIELQPGWPHC